MVNKLLGPDPAAPLKPLNDPNDLEGLDLDLLPPDPPPAVARPAAGRPAPAPRSELADVTFDGDEPAEQAVPARSLEPEPAEVFFSDEHDAVDEDLAAPAAVAAEESEKPGDSYWDALADLNPAHDADEPVAAPRGGRGGRGGGGGGGGRGDRRGGGRSGSGGRDAGRSRSRDDRPSREERPVRSSDAGRSAERVDRAERKSEGGSRSAPRPAPVNADLFGDDDFGIGLTEESRAQIEAAEAPPEADFDAPPEGVAGDARPRRRRGRRGRRGRGRPREEGAAQSTGAVLPDDLPPADDDAVSFDDEAPVRSRAERPTAPREAAPVDFDEPAEGDDGFGVGLEGGARPARDEDEPPRSRSRRGGRGRSGGRAPVPADVAPREVVADDEATDADDEGATETAEERRDRYRNIPTWEEAISYLVRPKRRSSGSGRSSGRPSRGSRGH